MDQDLKEIDDWLKEHKTTADLVEEAYKIWRGAHRGELPKYIRNHWLDTPSAYRQFLVFLTQHVLDAKAAS